MGTTYCMHIPLLWLPLHTRLYCLQHRYIQRYCAGIYLCVHTGIYLLYTPSELEWLLRQLIKTCTYIAYTCTYCVYTCTYTVHGNHILYAYTNQATVDGLLCFCSIRVWSGIKKIAIFWTGTAPIHIVPCSRLGGPRDVPQSCICISLSATKTCRDTWLHHVHTLYIHVHTWFIHVHSMYMSTFYFMHVPLW